MNHDQKYYMDNVGKNSWEIDTLREENAKLRDRLDRVEAKVDSMENRLLPPGCLYIPKPEITPAGQTANVCIADAFHVADTHTEIKSFAEKEFADMTIAELRREQEKPIDKEAKP